MLVLIKYNIPMKDDNNITNTCRNAPCTTRLPCIILVRCPFYDLKWKLLLKPRIEWIFGKYIHVMTYLGTIGTGLAGRLMSIRHSHMYLMFTIVNKRAIRKLVDSLISSTRKQ